MNIRKAIILLELLIYSFVIFELYKATDDSLLKCIFAFSLLIVIEIILFSYEQIKLVKLRKAFIINVRRSYLSIRGFINIAFVISFSVILLYKYFGSNSNGLNLFIFTFLLSLRELFFMTQRDSVLVTNDTFYFNNLLEPDINFAEIEDIRLSEGKNNIELSTRNHKRIIIRVDKDFFAENKNKLEKLVNAIKFL